VAKVEWHPGELYPRVGFIVTNLARPAERVIAFYNQRGTAERWIKEGKGAAKWTWLSCRTFAADAVRPQLHALAYNLGNFMRTLAMPKTAEPCSLTSLREKLIKIGAKVVSHGALCDLPDGRGRGVATDVRRHPLADRSAGTARAGMTSASQVHRAMRGEVSLGTPWCKQSSAFQRRATVDDQLRWPFARGDGDLPLPKPVRSAILTSKRPGIWRMSARSIANTRRRLSATFCAALSRTFGRPSPLRPKHLVNPLPILYLLANSHAFPLRCTAFSNLVDRDRSSRAG